MQKIFIDILARLEPEIKPEGQFKQSQTGRSEDFSPQKSPQKSWENFPRPDRQTLRSPKTGSAIPCDICGHIWTSGGCCVSCGSRRVATEEAGLEAIGSAQPSQVPAEKRGATRLSHPTNLGKPQIQSCPGVPMRQRARYRVVLGDEILGERLTIDQALALAKRG